MSNKKPTVIPLEQFGKDHWSTFLYIETRCVDHGGKLEHMHMRTCAKKHPHLVGGFRSDPGPITTTRLRPDPKTNRLAQADHMHDDWDCAFDLVREGLLLDGGTGLNPRFSLTLLGWTVSMQLRKHKSEGGNFCDFIPFMQNEASIL